MATIVTRAGKGSPLTHVEVDANFTNLNNDKAELAAPAFTGQASFADGTAAAPSIANTGDLNAGLFFPAADTVAITTGGSERMRVDINGNVGIGGTVPASLPKVGLYGGIRFLANETAAATYTGIGSIASDTVCISTSATERMRIDASGNVGIGTVLPGSVLDVVGTSTTDIFHVRNGTTYFTVGVTSGGASAINAFQTAVGAQQLQFQTAGGTSYFGGNVGIGTTSPQAKLDIVYTGLQFRIANSASSGYGFAQFGQSATATQNWHIGSEGDGTFRLYNGNSGAGSERMRIEASGNVGIGTTSPITPLHVAGASITNGVVYKAQAAQTSKAAAATLTIAELLTGIIQYTGAVATLTLPTGASIEGGLPATFPTNMSFDVSFINTGAALLTIGANGNTTVGTMTVTTGTSAMLRFRKTAANTYTVYRIS